MGNETETKTARDEDCDHLAKKRMRLDGALVDQCTACKGEWAIDEPKAPDEDFGASTPVDEMHRGIVLSKSAFDSISGEAPDVGGPELPPGCTHGVCETCHLRVCQNIVAELRTRLTEADKHILSLNGMLDRERARAGKAPDVGGPELPPGWSIDTGLGSHTLLDAEGRPHSAADADARAGLVVRSWRSFGITRKEWARLQGVDAELGKTRDWCVHMEEKFQLVSRQRNTATSDIAELRTRLTEAEGALAAIPDLEQPNGIPISYSEHLARCSGRSLRERDTERARADRLFRQLSFKADDVSRMRGCIVNLKAEAAALQKRVAELEGEADEREEGLASATGTMNSAIDRWATERARADRAEVLLAELHTRNRSSISRWARTHDALQKRVAELEGERERVIASVGKIALSLGDAVSRRRWGQVDAAGDRLDGVLGMLRKASRPTDGEAT